MALTRNSLISAFATYFASGYSAHASDVYVCTAVKTVGFSYDFDAKEWKPTNFQDSGSYIVRKDNDKWHWGKSDAKADAGCNEVMGDIICRGLQDFRVDTHSLRFQTVSPLGYLGVGRDGDMSPFMQIGKCVGN